MPGEGAPSGPRAMILTELENIRRNLQTVWLGVTTRSPGHESDRTVADLEAAAASRGGGLHRDS